VQRFALHRVRDTNGENAHGEETGSKQQRT
jgi:hypothetical protein